MTKRVAILQSNYIPWKGYFDMIAAVDEFIIFDDMQFTRRDWRNRNLIKTPQGLHWLTVPVRVKGRFHQSIRQTEIDGSTWSLLHWKSLVQHYQRAACFVEISGWLKPIYLESRFDRLSDLNRCLIDVVCSYLGIETVISDSAGYRLAEGKTERLVSLCLQAGATEYVSGPAAREYIDATMFADAGIKLSWFDYSGYAPYPQLWGAFEHRVSVLDLLFNCGKSARKFMKCVP